MSVETKVPAIPAVTDANVTAAVRHIKHLLDVREGRVGDFLDANVTFRDLVKSGLAVSPGWASPAYPVAPPGVFPNGYNPATDYTPPSSPAGVVAAGGIGTIILQWDDPGYRNHGYAEVWRSATNVIGNAVLHGTTDTRFYTDPIGAGASFYYWVRFVSLGNVTGPYQGVDGVLGATGQDPSYLTSLLVGQLSTSQLNTALNTRIDLIDGPANLAGSVNARVLTEANARAAAITAEASTRAQALLNEAQARGAAITTEAQTRATADTSLAGQITTLTAAVNTADTNLAAAIQTEATTRATADTAEAQARTTLAARVTTAEGAITANAAAITTEAQTRATADTSLAGQITTLSSQVNNATTGLPATRSLLVNDYYTKANTDSAISTATTTLQSSVNDQLTGYATTAALQIEATTRASIDGGLLAQFTVKTQVNGYISGFGLASTSNNAAPTSEFLVLADAFKIASPSGPGITPAAPFIVRTTPPTIGGVNVPVGVYMQEAFIANGTIGNAKIADLAVDNAKIANLDAAKITTGFLSADRIQAGTIDAKIANIDAAKITSGFISSAVINTASIANATITNAQIQSLDASKITTGRLTAAQIDGTNLSINAAGVELGADVGPGAGHYGLSLSGSDFNNIFLRRHDGVTFFRVNDGGANSMTFDSASGQLSVTGNLTARSFSTIGGRFTADASGNVIADRVSVRRRDAVATGSGYLGQIISTTRYGDQGGDNGPSATYSQDSATDFWLDPGIDDPAFSNSSINQHYGALLRFSGSYVWWASGSPGVDLFSTYIHCEPRVRETHMTVGSAVSSSARIWLLCKIAIRNVSTSAAIYQIRLDNYSWSLFKV